MRGATNLPSPPTTASFTRRKRFQHHRFLDGILCTTIDGASKGRRAEEEGRKSAGVARRMCYEEGANKSHNKTHDERHIKLSTELAKQDRLHEGKGADTKNNFDPDRGASELA